MAVQLFNNGTHACLAFYDLVDEEADHAVQCNQFLIVDGQHGALIDPGGNMTYSGLLMAMPRTVSARASASGRAGAASRRPGMSTIRLCSPRRADPTPP